MPDMLRVRQPEEVGISFKIAERQDLSKIEGFLEQPQIDNLFTPPLSDPIRGISISQRVQTKYETGFWAISETPDGQIVGCMAVVPAKISTEPIEINLENGIEISSGVSLSGWKVKRIMELSTVATNPETKLKFAVKGIGEKLLLQVIEQLHTSEFNNVGLVTDSWLGGQMDGFINHVINKMPTNPVTYNIDTLIRIYFDPKKRGKKGPPTTLYLIPNSEKDWAFLINNQNQIKELRLLYSKLANQE